MDKSQTGRWVGHILRLPDERLIKQTLKVIFDNPQDGDILMDTGKNSWQELQRMAKADNKKTWRIKVNELKLAAQRTTKPRRAKANSYVHRNNAPKTRFTFKTAAARPTKDNGKKKKKKKASSNEAARAAYYQQLTKKADDYEERLHFFEKRKRENDKQTTPAWEMPAWNLAAEAVFSSSSSSSGSDLSWNTDNSDADFQPKHNSTILYRKQTSPLQRKQTPPLQHKQASPLQRKQTPLQQKQVGDDDDDDELWAEPLPTHLLQTPSPTHTNNTNSHIHSNNYTTTCLH